MKTRLPLAFILITLMIDSIGIGLIIPVMPSLIQEVEGANLAQAAIWGGILTTTFAVMQFAFGPILGNLSDRYGRRPVLLLSLGVMALDYLVMALAGSIWLLLVGRIVGGMTAATQSVAYAFVADISKPEEKAARFGLIGAAFGLGFVIGPLLGGLLAEYRDPRALLCRSTSCRTEPRLRLVHPARNGDRPDPPSVPMVPREPVRSVQGPVGAARDRTVWWACSFSIRLPSWSIPRSGRSSPKPALAGILQ